MKKNILNFLLSGNVSDEDYAVAKEDMYCNNVMMLRVLSAIATTIFIVCAILGVTVPNMNSKMSTYLVGMAFSIAILLSAFYSKNAKLHTICMCFLDVMLLSVGLLITLVSAPQQLTVTLIPVALLVPLFFDVKPCVFLTVVGLSDLIYLIFAPIVKPGDILALDMVDVLAFSIAGIVIGTIITKVKVERYVYANRIRRIALQDGLTECFNRKAYVDDTSNLSSEYPNDFVYISMDVNGLKVVNDSLGHEAGDELIIGACKCINESMKSHGDLYRTGGDEFIALIKASDDEIDRIERDIVDISGEWRGKLVKSLSIL